MICKKCKTAYNEKSHSCPYCGKYSAKSGRLKIIAGSFCFVSIVLFCGLYIYEKPNLSLRVPAPVSSTSLPDEDQEEMPDSDTLPPETVSTEKPRSGQDNFAMLNEICVSLNSYFDKFSVYTNFISKRGYLFDMTSSDYVTVGKLIDTGLLASSYKSAQVYLLFLRPSDFSEFKELKFSDSKQLELFAACETTDGVALVSQNNAGLLYRENYNSLIAKYNFIHGAIETPIASDERYTTAKQALCGYFNVDDIDIRYFSCDEKYSVVYASHKNESNMLYMFVLNSLENKFEILLNNIEQYTSMQSEINKKIPDFNPELIPQLNYAKYQSVMMTDYGVIEDFLVADGYITESGLPFSYICGTNKFAFAKTASGDLFLCWLNSAGKWTAKYCSDYKEAVVILRLHDPNPPLFILLQE